MNRKIIGNESITPKEVENSQTEWNEKVKGACNRCFYDAESSELNVNGWYLPRPDRVEIWADGRKVGEAKLGVKRWDVFENFPDCNDQNAGWECKIEQIRCKPGIVSSRAIYGEVCKKEDHVLKIEKQVLGKIDECYYEEKLQQLDISGWYLPRPDKIRIILDNIYAVEGELGITQGATCNTFRYHDDKQCRWEFTCNMLKKQPQSVNVQVVYDDVVEYEESRKVERKIWGSVSKCYYDLSLNLLVAEGWFLPEPDEIVICADGKRYSDVRRGIERLDVYHQFERYQNRLSGWIFEKEFKVPVREVKIISKYNDGQEYVKNLQVQERTFVDRKAVNVCEYNDILCCFKINGWCLPVPEKIEIWNEHVLLGKARLNIRRDDVYKNFAQYAERNAGWEFTRKYCSEAIDKVTVNFIWKNDEIRQIDVNVKQKRYQVVSFDIFDTLVVRPVVRPTDIFKIVGIRIGDPDHFKEMRIIAEKYARKHKRKETDDIGIDEIYDRFQELYDITDREKEVMKSSEIQVEKEYVQPRHAVQKFYERALKSGAEVIVTSDMYLPFDVIEEILWNCGYRNYVRLFLSGKENASKRSGKLYDKLIRIYAEKNISPGDILHIGDNLQVDIMVAKQKGLDTFYIPKTMAMFQNNSKLSLYTQYISTKLDNQFFVGFLANKIFDDPFIEYDKNTFCNGEYKYFGIVLFAPFLLEFTLWMLKNLEESGYNTVFLAYRDGYMIGKIMELLKSKLKLTVKTVPVYLSRAVRYNGYCRKKNGFSRAFLDYKVSPNMNVEEFVKKRLLVEDEAEKQMVSMYLAEKCNMQKEDSVGDLEWMYPVLKKISDVYNRHAIYNMRFIDKYCDKLFQEHKKIAVFDVGYRGSVVDFIRTLYGKEAFGFQILSYSFAERHTAGAKYTKSYIQYGVKLKDSIGILHSLLEDVVSVEEGTANKIVEKDGELLVSKEDYRNDSDILRIIQKQILEFIHEFLEIFGEDIYSLELDRYAEFDFICDFLKSANKKDAEILRNIHFCDSDFLGDTCKNIYQKWYNEREE